MPIIIHLAGVDGVDDIDMDNHGHYHQSKLVSQTSERRPLPQTIIIFLEPILAAMLYF